MKPIPLTRGKFAIVDDEDFEDLSRYKWNAVKSNNTFYAYRTAYHPKRTIQMHRYLLGLTGATKVDHKDGDGLNNQRLNLRAATNSENLQNAKKYRGAMCPHKGVSMLRRVKAGRWTVSYQANIQIASGYLYLGIFPNPILAAMAYDASARVHFGKFAKPNFLQ